MKILSFIFLLVIQLKSIFAMMVEHEIKNTQGEYVTARLDIEKKDSDIGITMAFLLSINGDKIGEMNVVFEKKYYGENLIITNLRNHSITEQGSKNTFGVGSYLINQAKSLAKNEGLTTIKVTASYPNKVASPQPLCNNPPAFYQKMGFQVFGNTSEGVVMKYVLEDQ